MKMADNLHGTNVQNKKPKSEWGVKHGKTAAAYTAYFLHGCTTVLLGTTMIDMQKLLQTDTKTIGTMFTGSGAGRLIGAVLCGLMFNRFKPELQISIACFCQVILLSAAPWIPLLSVYFTFTMLCFVSYAYINASIQPFTIQLWDKHPHLNPIIQASEAIYSIGATIGPFVVRPFVTSNTDYVNLPSQATGNTTSGAIYMTGMNNTLLPGMQASDTLYSISTATIQPVMMRPFLTPNNHFGNSTYMVSNATDETQIANINLNNVGYDGNVQYVFGLIGGLYLIPAISFLVFSCTSKSSAPQEHWKEREEVNNRRRRRPKLFTIFFYFLMFFLNFSYMGIESSVGGYITVYAARGLNYGKSTGLLCASVFFGCFGCGRLLGIVISTRIKQGTILMCNYLLAILGLVCLLFVHVHHSVLWIGISLSAIGFSTVFATQVLWCSEQIPFDGVAAGVVHTGASVGVMTGPALTGLLMQTLGHQWLVYVMLIKCFMVVIIYSCMQVLVYHRRRQARLSDKKEDEKLSMKNVHATDHLIGDI